MSDTFLSIKYEPKKNEVTGNALVEIQKLIDLVSVFEEIKPVIIEKEITHVLVKELITIYKWSYELCSIATFLPIFSDIIVDGMVQVQDIPKFDSLIYKVMGE